MKLIKRIFYGIIALLMALFAIVIYCALNPSASEKLADALYGQDDQGGIFDLDQNGKYELPNVILDENENPKPITLTLDNPGYEIYNVLGEVADSLPSNVSGLNGLVPVQESLNEVTDAEADNISDALNEGESGADLEFDASLYPYYYMLNDAQRSLYRQIYANALKRNSSFSPNVEISAPSARDAFEAVLNDHPELFYLDSGYSVKYTKSGRVVEVDLEYYTIVNDFDNAKKQFDDAANAIVSAAMSLGDDYAKEKYVHDALMDKVSYNERATMNQSAYSALVNNSSVCAGYARAYQLIMQKLGIPCYYCTGYAGQDHAWNIVKLSDGFYNVDVTWDDTDPTTHDYFNKTDYDYVGTHKRTGMAVKLPACNGTLYRNQEDNQNNMQVADSGDISSPYEQMKPLRYEEEKNKNIINNESDKADKTQTEDKERAALLLEAGLTEDQVSFTLEDYYNRCYELLVAAGSGDQSIEVIIPDSLLASIEQQYGNGGYEEGYVKKTLEKLGMTGFSMQIQAQHLKGGFYKLYHNVVTWNE